MSVTANISNISRSSLHDGPGLRTVVYFKGCSLRCEWCHNPETISHVKEIMFQEGKCIACGRCISLCRKAYSVVDGKIMFSRGNCISCGKCVELCPSGAISMCGEEMTVDALFSVIEKDAHYYKESGGGVTFSGGECLLQPEAVTELAERCKEEGIHTAIESAFHVPYANVEKVLPFIDFIFADLKIADGEKHRQHTGASNELIIENIRKISGVHSCITIRIPLVPEVNDTEKSMEEFSEIIKSFGSGIIGVELLKYNYLAASKYRLVGRDYTDFGSESQTDEKLELLCKALKRKLPDRINVYYVK